MQRRIAPGIPGVEVHAIGQEEVPGQAKQEQGVGAPEGCQAVQGSPALPIDGSQVGARPDQLVQAFGDAIPRPGTVEQKVGGGPTVAIKRPRVGPGSEQGLEHQRSVGDAGGRREVQRGAAVDIPGADRGGL